MYCLKQKTDWKELIHFYDIKNIADAAESYLILLYRVRHLILDYMSLTLTHELPATFRKRPSLKTESYYFKTL